VAEAGAVRDRVDAAWQSIKAGLITGVSIGYLPRPGGVKFLKHGLHLLQTDIFELSLVTIPANVDATILAVKSLDAPYVAAERSASPTTRKRTAQPMTHKEIIQNFENKRAAIVARMDLLMADANAAGETLTGDQATEYDRLALEVKSIDEHLVRARELERLNAAAATPVAGNGNGSSAAAPRVPVVSIRPTVELGTAFIRQACAKAACRGNLYEAALWAERWNDSTPEVALFLKAAVAAGSTTDATWAKPLVQPGNTIVEEFLTLLRPATVIGRIPNLSKVPFNVNVPAVTGGGTYNWVGEGLAKPVTKMAFGSATLPPSKAAGIIVLTEELVRLSNPSAEQVVRREMIAGIAAFLDSQFLDPAIAEVVNVHPASITNGLTPITATSNPYADILALIGKFTTAKVPLTGLTIVMTQNNALALSFQKAGGTTVFPGLSATGGTINGINVVTSQAAGDMIIAIAAPYILVADDGGVTVDISREASVQMHSAPDSPPIATTVLVSLWQNNLVGLRAERFINWKRGLADAVAYIDGAAYAPPAPSMATAV
jgi:HK97 family phage major capsid protein